MNLDRRLFMARSIEIYVLLFHSFRKWIALPGDCHQFNFYD